MSGSTASKPVPFAATLLESVGSIMAIVSGVTGAHSFIVNMNGTGTASGTWLLMLAGFAFGLILVGIGALLKGG